MLDIPCKCVQGWEGCEYAEQFVEIFFQPSVEQWSDKFIHSPGGDKVKNIYLVEMRH